jgi:site-specific recombinase XerC
MDSSSLANNFFDQNSDANVYLAFRGRRYLLAHHVYAHSGVDRRTKATLIYRRTKNLRAVQLLLGHSKLDSTVRYLGIEIDDALEISEQIDV